MTDVAGRRGAEAEKRFDEKKNGGGNAYGADCGGGVYGSSSGGGGDST